MLHHHSPRGLASPKPGAPPRVIWQFITGLIHKHNEMYLHICQVLFCRRSGPTEDEWTAPFYMSLAGKQLECSTRLINNDAFEGELQTPQICGGVTRASSWMTLTVFHQILQIFKFPMVSINTRSWGGFFRAGTNAALEALVNGPLILSYMTGLLSKVNWSAAVSTLLPLIAASCRKV